MKFKLFLNLFLEMTLFVLTKYEISRVIGERAKLLANNAEPTIDVGKIKDPTPINIAKEEFRQNKIPLIITRTFPNGKIQEINLYEN